MTSLEKMEEQDKLGHEQVGHKVTTEEMLNGRTYWHCRSCGMQGSYKTNAETSEFDVLDQFLIEKAKGA